MNYVRPFAGLSTEPFLLADICGHLVIAGFIVSVLLPIGLANHLVGPSAGLILSFVLASAFVAMAVCARKRVIELLDRFLGWSNSLFPTPDLLQRGYTWIEKRSAIGYLCFFGLPLSIILLQPLLARRLESGGAEEDIGADGNFIALLAAVLSAYAIYVVLLLLASLVAGYFNRSAGHR